MHDRHSPCGGEQDRLKRLSRGCGRYLAVTLRCEPHSRRASRPCFAGHLRMTAELMHPRALQMAVDLLVVVEPLDRAIERVALQGLDLLFLRGDALGDNLAVEVL